MMGTISVEDGQPMPDLNQACLLSAVALFLPFFLARVLFLLSFFPFCIYQFFLHPVFCAVSVYEWADCVLILLVFSPLLTAGF